MISTARAQISQTAQSSWQMIVAKYQNPDVRRSLWQVANSFGPYLILWYLMYRSLEVSYGLTLALSVLATGFLMRIFIIFHDCGHGSFFKSQKANDLVGSIAGLLVFTPYFNWRHDHAVHHATAGDLDRRGIGDVKTMTVKEYLQASWWRKLGYRLYRHPLVLLGLGPLFTFLVAHRFATPGVGRRERLSVVWTNLALLAIALLLGRAIGFQAYLLIQLPITVLSSTVGVWLFYTQHQFETTTWERHETWDYVSAALQGSSYFKLPKVLQWFTGNIGFHHIHHLSPRIPNYELPKCHEENPQFQQVTTITLWTSLKVLSLRLWDEEQKKLVTFAHLRTLQPA